MLPLPRTGDVEALNGESPVDDAESLQVRDLQGEDLDLLAHHCPGVRIRFLVEACEMLAARDGGDLLVIAARGEVWAAAATGYGSRFDDVRIVTAGQPRGQGALRRLLTDIEARTTWRRCTTLVAAVDVLDQMGRRTFELLGYVMTGAGVAVWSERTTPGPPERAVDTWTMRKQAAPVPRR
jgi:hypothetical protein